MTTGMPDSKPGAALDAGDDDAFAATVVEEMLEGDDGEAVPGSVPPDERQLQAMPTIGHVGRYALKHQLGAGGLGAVYAALDPLLSRPIAVKMLRVAELPRLCPRLEHLTLLVVVGATVYDADAQTILFD